MTNHSRRVLHLFAIAMFVLCPAIAMAADPASQEYSLLSPRPGQFDFRLENVSGFIGPGSIVRVREFGTEGTGLHFPALGINTVQIPDLDVTYWFNQLNALDLQLRYFDVGGDHFFSGPAFFNGATIAPGQTLHTNPSNWFSLGIYYERRLTPLLRRFETSWPELLQGWDLRARAGLEYTYLCFAIDDGRAPVTKTSKGEETKEDFYHQELPAPTLALEMLHAVGDYFSFDGSIKGNWINRWNSLRNEGGTVWSSQSGVEGHLRVLYSDSRLGGLHPMIGFALYYYNQSERSTEDGNFIRWLTYGPEYGVEFNF